MKGKVAPTKSTTKAYVSLSFSLSTVPFKILHGLSPDYLKELVTIKEISRYNLRSNNGLLLEIPSIKSKKALSDHSISFTPFSNVLSF